MTKSISKSFMFRKYYQSKNTQPIKTEMQKHMTFVIIVFLLIIQTYSAQETEIILIKDQFFFNSYLYKTPTNKYVLIDTTRHNRENIILEELKKRKIDPKDIVNLKIHGLLFLLFIFKHFYRFQVNFLKF
jgi:hypothetical protein